MIRAIRKRIREQRAELEAETAVYKSLQQLFRNELDQMAGAALARQWARERRQKEEAGSAMSGFSVQNPWDEPGYDEREAEGYKVAAQPGRAIELTHPQHGRLTVMPGCAGALIELLEWARDLQWQEGDDDR